METSEERKGLCNNIGVCSKANSKEIQVIADPFADFICSECEMQLEETVEEKPKRKIPKWIIPVASGITVLGLLVVFVPPMFRTDNIKESIKKDVSPISTTDSMRSSTDNNAKLPELVTDNPKPKVNKIEGNNGISNEDVLIASTLEDGLQKIGNLSYTRSNRKALISKMLTKFESKSIPVKVLRGNDEYEYFKVKQYMDRILIQGIHDISVVKQTKNNSGLINELIVNEK
jgi:hypothetical protein